MREILFKAKKIVSGEWLQGLLWKKKYHSNSIFISCFPDEDDREEVYRIDEKTICQYTGVKDKNGRKIWEGDILIAIDPYYPNEKFYLKYDKEVISFIGIYIGFEKLFHVHKELLENCEVIGNIFDNKELLEN